MNLQIYGGLAALIFVLVIVYLFFKDLHNQ